MTVYGYARVSTVQQDLTLQVQALSNYGIPAEMIFTDKRTGKDMERQSLKELLSIIKEGDVIVVNKLDRLGRSVSQVTTLIDDLTKKGIFVKSISEGIDTSNDSTMSKAMLHMLAMFAEMERNFILERTKPAIENAKAKGVKFGRPKASKKVYEMAVQEYLAGGVTVKELIAKYGKDSNGKDLITEATLFRRVREYKKANAMD
jgi:DNA invertase Pin-like site-specific DNA recombinase